MDNRVKPIAAQSGSDDGRETVAYTSGPPLGMDVPPEKVGDYAPVQGITSGPRYTLSSLHGAGGMGNVWLARDASLDRDVAIKELRVGGPTASRAHARFVREAKITGQLEHPGIVPVYELGHDPNSGRPFYVMRFVRGRTLTEVAAEFHKSRRADWYESMELVKLLTAFVSICNTIGYAHSHGIIHRDLKGENIILGEFGEVIVLDWGLAKQFDSAREDAGLETLDAEPALGQTMSGQAVGTPAYMSPEQAAGQLDGIGPATDIFGLGAVLYEILTGRPPYKGVTTDEVLRLARECKIAPPRDIWPEVPTGLEVTCLKALARAPEDRFPSAVAMGQEVQAWQDRQRRKAEDELRQAFERLRRQQVALVELTQTETFSGPDLTAIFRQLIEVAARTLGVERVSIWRFTPDRRAIRCHALYELASGAYFDGMELNADAYPNYFAALAATDVIAADDAQRDSRTCEFTDGYLVPFGIGAMMEVPIHPDGVLCHEHVGPPRKWLPDEQLFGIAVGHLAAHAISQWERQQALEQLQLARMGT